MIIFYCLLAFTRNCQILKRVKKKKTKKRKYFTIAGRTLIAWSEVFRAVRNTGEIASISNGVVGRSSVSRARTSSSSHVIYNSIDVNPDGN